MRRPLLALAKRAYGAVRSRTVREGLFNAFAMLMRNRTSIADIDGHRFELDLGESIDLSLYLEQFEPEVTAVLRRETKPGMTVFDIGANIGAHTMLLASRVGNEGRVVAFEPTDFAFRKLQRNLSLNSLPWVTAVKAALSDQNSPGLPVNFRASWRTDGGRRDGSSVVDFIRLDDWCADNEVTSVDVIKMDVDGNEFPILAGAREIITQNLPLFVMEAVAPHFTNPDRNPFGFLEHHGYEFRDVHGGATLSLDALRRQLPDHDPEMTASTNVIAIPGRLR
jgi:FkbM family methyltransferase